MSISAHHEDGMPTRNSLPRASIRRNRDRRQESVASGPATLYAALLYTYTEGTGPDATTYRMGNFAEGFIEATASATVSNLGLKINGNSAGAATAWTTATAVPEPTSAMLLLGMAGLALRRRRA